MTIRETVQKTSVTVSSHKARTFCFAQWAAYRMDTTVHVIDNHKQVKTANYFKYTDHQSC